MAEELKKVNAGDRIEISAATWNSFVDAANYVKLHQGQPGMQRGGAPSPCYVTVRNMTGAVLPCYSLVYLSDLAIKPVSGSEADFAFEQIVFDATLSPSSTVDTNSKMVITQEPLEANACGRAMLSGVTHATANITSADHLFVASDGSGGLESADAGLLIIWSDGTTGSSKPVLVLLQQPEQCQFWMSLVSGSSPKLKVSGGIAELNGTMTDVTGAEITVDPEDIDQFRDGVGWCCLTWDGTTASFEIVANPVMYDYNGEFAIRENSIGYIEVYSVPEPSIAGRAMLNGTYQTIPRGELPPDDGYVCLTWDGETAEFEIVPQSESKQPRTLIELEV